MLAKTGPLQPWKNKNKMSRAMLQQFMKKNTKISPMKATLIQRYVQPVTTYDNTLVPQTPLMSAKVLREEEEMWVDVQEEMTNALATMRVDYDQVVNIKTLGQSNNALLKKRQRREQAPEAAASSMQ